MSQTAVTGEYLIGMQSIADGDSHKSFHAVMHEGRRCYGRHR